MSGAILLDTNAVIARLAGDKALQQRLEAADEVFLPSIVLGEMYYGAYHSGRSADNLARVEQFAAGRVVLGCDTATAKIYGQILHKLHLKGRPLPDNDIWIGAIAVQHGLTLVTRDAHFQEIEGLTVEGW